MWIMPEIMPPEYRKLPKLKSIAPSHHQFRQSAKSKYGGGNCSAG